MPNYLEEPISILMSEPSKMGHCEHPEIDIEGEDKETKTGVFLSHGICFSTDAK